MNLPRFSAALLALFGVIAPATAQTSVFKVTSGANSIYLGGTIHLLRPQDYPLPVEFDRAFEASQALYFETDIARMQEPAFQVQLMTRGMYADGTTLDKVLTPAAWKAVEAYCAKAGLPLAAVRPMRPAIFVLLVLQLEVEKMGATATGVDLHYHKLAGLKGKTVHALEPAEKHIEYILNLGAGHESELILEGLEDSDALAKEFSEMAAAWRKGDLKKLDDLDLLETRQKYPRVYQELMVDRNRVWLPIIEGLLKTAPTEFILVGAAHLAGPDGILADLGKKGFKIEQVTGAK